MVILINELILINQNALIKMNAVLPAPKTAALKIPFREANIPGGDAAAQ